jgi:hypothetical protein
MYISTCIYVYINIHKCVYTYTAHVPGTYRKAQKEFERKNNARDPLNVDDDESDPLEKVNI